MNNEHEISQFSCSQWIYSEMNLNMQAKERVHCIFFTHSCDQNLHLFGEWLATSLALELGTRKASDCPINWRASGSGQS